MNFAHIQRSSLYHTAGDSIANLDRGNLQHHGSNMLALARAIGGLTWLAGLGVLCAQVAPGASFLFALPALLGALGWLAAVLLRRPAFARTVAAMLGPVTAAMLLPSLAGDVLDGMGPALGGVSALVLALFGLVAVPVAELFLPDPSTGPKRAAVLAVPLTALVLTVGLVAVGLVTDDFDADRPRRTHLAYVMDAATRTAHRVSADTDPAPWTRRYVSGHDISTLPPGYARGTLWTGPAPAITAGGPRANVLAHRGDTLKLHVTAGRGARSVTLRLDQPITHTTASAAGFRSASVPVTGPRTDTWPSEIRFRGIPARGVQITVRLPAKDRIRLTVIAETDGLTAAPGFVPKPPDLVAATREDGDLTTVTRTYTLTGDS
ncbi:hypothetical protein [Streptosporangium sandarakinum]|uniref:hypothetical protein n=1 Tax=Streptosporangium sandarakinum TaxID=1260955 RepID=UPI0034138C9F